MKILVLDNYDSFTYNLVHLLKELGHEPDVIRNDKISIEEVNKYDKILLSPGPGLPSEAGIMPTLLQKYSAYKSILGVCLGHQAIGEAFGGSLTNLTDVFHGVATQTSILDDKEVLFAAVPPQIATCRYHSWIVNSYDLPECLEITAVDEHGNIMAIRHKEYDVRGVQFHPESYITEYGKQMISNWLNATIHPIT
jgi:anthranilate synthase component 2